LPKAAVLKIPHHGGKNAFDLAAANKTTKRVNCWDSCINKPIAIIFAGDFEHPDPGILKDLEARTELHSFFDLHANAQRLNPLRLHTIGARAVDQSLRPQTFCKIIVEVDSNGKVQLINH
jgi:hypothetical protein